MQLPPFLRRLTPVVLLGTFLLAGCARQETNSILSPEDAITLGDKNRKLIVGKWQKEGTDSLIEYFPDGRMAVSSTTGDPDLSATAKYSLVNPNLLSMENENGSGSFSISFESREKENDTLISQNTRMYPGVKENPKIVYKRLP